MGNSSNKIQYPGVIGLKNFSNSCYLNCGVQCLSNSPGISEYLLKLDELSFPEGSLAFEYVSLLQQIWAGDAKTLQPFGLKAAWAEEVKEEPGRDTEEQQDAFEFLLYLINALHKTLKVQEDPNKPSNDPFFHPEHLLPSRSISRPSSFHSDLSPEEESLELTDGATGMLVQEEDPEEAEEVTTSVILDEEVGNPILDEAEMQNTMDIDTITPSDSQVKNAVIKTNTISSPPFRTTLQPSTDSLSSSPIPTGMLDDDTLSSPGSPSDASLETTLNKQRSEKKRRFVRKFLLVGGRENKAMSERDQAMEMQTYQKIAAFSWKSYLEDKGWSIFTSHFHFQKKESIRCLSCGVEKVSFPVVKYLDVPLTFLEASALNDRNLRRKSVRPEWLQSCLKYLATHGETLENWGCPSCEKKTKARRTSQIWRAPKTLMLRLGRVVRRNKKDVKVTSTLMFPRKGLEIDCWAHRLEPSEAAPKLIFDLFSVLSHVGSSASEGHFIVHAQNNRNHNWYTFNDEGVHRFDIQKPAFRSSDAYVLFYHVRKGRPRSPSLTSVPSLLCGFSYSRDTESDADEADNVDQTPYRYRYCI